jgi:hypothetical protein
MNEYRHRCEIYCTGTHGAVVCVFITISVTIILSSSSSIMITPSITRTVICYLKLFITRPGGGRVRVSLYLSLLFSFFSYLFDLFEFGFPANLRFYLFCSQDTLNIEHAFTIQDQKEGLRTSWQSRISAEL